MKHTFLNRLLSVTLTVILLLSILPSSVFADERTVVQSGFCGIISDYYYSDVNYTFYDDGELVILGTGSMSYFDNSDGVYNVPWYIA